MGFPVLAFRMLLEPILPKAKGLATESFNKNLRVVTSIDEVSDVFLTKTPSGPIVALAAMKHLLSGVNSWDKSLSTLIAQLNNSEIDKGLKGELYVRTMLTLAHDQAFRQQRTTNSLLITVETFLESLYGTDENRVLKAKLPREILDAHLNFLQFCTATPNLEADILPKLLVEMLRRRAALQLASNQQDYDLLIPLYFGDVETAVQEEECGVLLVQVKARGVHTATSAIVPQDYTSQTTRAKRQCVESHKRPIKLLAKIKKDALLLIFDLLPNRARRHKDTLKYNTWENTGTKHKMHTIHSLGHGPEVFEPATTNRNAEDLWKATAPAEHLDPVQQEICTANDPFARWDKHRPEESVDGK